MPRARPPHHGRPITRAVKRRLKQIQYRPDLVDACLAATGLIADR
ncbi:MULTISPECIES: hypothetical protein [unclassified Streptomyces]|jgi:hypothetical protein